MELVPLNIYRSRKKIWYAIIGCLVFVTGSIFMLVARDDVFAIIISILCLAIFGGGMMLFLYQLTRNHPLLSFDRNGFYQKNIGLIAWNDVAGIGSVLVRSQKYVVVFLKKPEYFIDSRSQPGRAAYAFNYRLTGSPIAISSVNMEYSFEELLKLFNEWHNAYQLKEHAH